MAAKHNQNIVRDLELAIAQHLLAAAIRLQAEHQRRLSVGNPAPHLDPAPKGDYPRARSGFLRSNVAVEPTSLAAIIAKGMRIRVGYRASAFYGVALARRGWKGLGETAAELRNELAGMIGDTAAIGGI